MISTTHAHAERLVDRGFALFAADRFAEAEAAFRAAIFCDPDDEDGWIGLGSCLGRQRRHAEAALIFGLGAVLADTEGVWSTLLAAEALLDCGAAHKARASLAWFDELVRTGKADDDQKAMGTLLRSRAGRQP